MARVVHRLVRYGAAYVKRTEQKVRELMEKKLKRRARELGSR